MKSHCFVFVFYLRLCCLGLSVAQVPRPLTVHVLDTSNGQDAANMTCELFRKRTNRNSFQLMTTSTTDANGRANLLPVNAIGIYRLRLNTQSYFSAKALETFWPIWDVTFNVSYAFLDNHIPVTFSQFGFTTYRGSSF